MTGSFALGSMFGDQTLRYKQSSEHVGGISDMMGRSLYLFKSWAGASPVELNNHIIFNRFKRNQNQNQNQKWFI